MADIKSPMAEIRRG